MTLSLADPLPPILGETEGLSAALQQIGANAMEALPNGGEILFKARPLGTAFMEIAVQDNGVGMSPEVLTHSLDPFFTTKPMGKGQGLGLSQVYGTVKAHGGTVDIQSHLGEGTKVVVTLPLITDFKGPRPTTAKVTAPSHPLRILLVDDDELIRTTFPPLIESLGHSVTSVAGGLEAIDCLKAGFKPDIVVLDLNMPGMDGSQTLHSIRERWPELNVLLATGFADDRVPPLLARFKHVGLLTKPFNLAELGKALSEFAEPLNTGL